MKCRTLRLFYKFKKQQNNINWENYKHVRNDYQNEPNLAEQRHKQDLSQSIADSKNTKTWWQTVKWLLGKRGNASYPPLNLNNSTILDNKNQS